MRDTHTTLNKSNFVTQKLEPNSLLYFSPFFPLRRTQHLLPSLDKSNPCPTHSFNEIKVLSRGELFLSFICVLGLESLGNLSRTSVRSVFRGPSSAPAAGFLQGRNVSEDPRPVPPPSAQQMIYTGIVFFLFLQGLKNRLEATFEPHNA